MPKKKDGGAVRVDNLSDRPFYLAVGDFCDFFFVGRDADGEGFVGGDNDWHKAEVTRAADNRLCLEILGVGEEVNVKLDLGQFEEDAQYIAPEGSRIEVSSSSDSAAAASSVNDCGLEYTTSDIVAQTKAYQRRARAAEEEAEATRRRLAEYEAAVQEERRRATLAAQDMADLQSQLDGLKVTAKQRTDEAARWHAQADTLAAQAQVLAPPATWTSHPDLAGGQEVALQPGSPEWSDVERRFIAGLGSVPPPVNRRDKSGRLQGITAIKRIENHRLWKSYATYRESLKARAADEGRAHDRYEQVGMFHGTSPAVIPKVVSQGFNRIFNGANAVVYGKGVYFALTSNYSDSYAHADAQGVKHMFICRVVVGEFCKGNNAQPVPDERLPASHVLYDSTTNDMNDAAREMYVVYHRRTRSTSSSTACVEQ